jgi:hypothetical protein
MGMAFGPYGALAGAIIGGGMGYMQGQSADANSALMQSYANYNADNALLVGQYNADALLSMSHWNANLAAAAGASNASAIMKVAQYNADVRGMVGAYNAELIRNEAGLLWQEADLRIDQIAIEGKRTQGKMRAGYAASNVIVNADTPMLALIDAETQNKLDQFIVRHGANIQAGKLLDKARGTEWETDIAVQQMMYQGRVNASNAAAQGNIAAAGLRARGYVDSIMMRYNSMNQAAQIRYSGQIKGYNNDQAFQANMRSSMFQSGASMGSQYMSSRPVTTTGSYSGSMTSTYTGAGSQTPNTAAWSGYAPTTAQNTSATGYGAFTWQRPADTQGFRYGTSYNAPGSLL